MRRVFLVRCYGVSGGWMLVTHLQGPHQSVCWLRPKRARHFLGEPGSERRHARHERGRRVGVGVGGNSQERREKRVRRTDTRQERERERVSGGGGGGTGGAGPVRGRSAGRTG